LCSFDAFHAKYRLTVQKQFNTKLSIYKVQSVLASYVLR